MNTCGCDPEVTPFSHLQMPDDAEALGPSQAAGGGGEEPVGPSDQKVTCGRVAAPLRAHIGHLRQQRPHGAAQGWGRGADMGGGHDKTPNLVYLE